MFKNQRFVSEGASIVNAQTGDRLDIPHGPAPRYEGLTSNAFRFKEAIALKDTMLWCWGWDTTEISTKPTFQFVAYEIGLEKGKLKVLRQAELKNLTGIQCRLFRVSGNTAVFASTTSVVDFDLLSWKEVESVRGRVLSPESGRLYRQNKLLAVHEWHGVGKWKQISPSIEVIQEAMTLNKNDIFVTRNALHNLDSKANFKMPWPDSKYDHSFSLFADPEVGIGVLWFSYPGSDESVVGAILNPKDLTSLCAVKPF